MSSKLLFSVALIAALAVVGCGSKEKATPTAPAVAKTAQALNAPFTFKVSDKTVTITVDAAQRPISSADEPVEVMCANLAADGFADRDSARTTWKKGAADVSVTLKNSAEGLDLCAVNFTARKGKQAAAFFDEQAKAKFLADQKTQ
jgi:hypothetical protein